MSTAAIELGAWLDPPLQAWLSPRSLNWHIALLDPVTKLAVAIPTGGALGFTWTNPPVQLTPQPVSGTVTDGVGLYHVVLPLTSSMLGKLLLTATLTDSGAAVVNTSTTMVRVFPSGQ